MTTIYVTTWALTSGIVCGVLDEAKSPSRIVAAVRWPSGASQCFYTPDWHLTYAVALMRAEEMRTKRIASLRKYIARLEALTFEEKDGEE